MKTIAQQLNVTDFPFEIKDKNNNLIYWENSNGCWSKREFDLNKNLIYWENSNGCWSKREFDLNKNLIYWKKSDGYWSKREYDLNNNQIYYENSIGIITDNRPKITPEYTIEELIAKVGFEFKIKK
jgi:hypothetical protein